MQDFERKVEIKSTLVSALSGPSFHFPRQRQERLAFRWGGLQQHAISAAAAGDTHHGGEDSMPGSLTLACRTSNAKVEIKSSLAMVFPFIFHATDMEGSPLDGID